MAKYVPKSQNQRLADLEAHLATMVGMMAGLQSGDAANLKDLATKLRVLAFSSAGNDGLLWALSDELQVEDLLPLKYEPLSSLHEALQTGILDLHDAANAWGTPIRTRLRSLKVHLWEDDALLVGDKALTNREVIKQLAEHSGTAHETPGVTKEMATLNILQLGQAQLYIPLVDRVARWVLKHSQAVLRTAERQGYERRRPVSEAPPVVSWPQVSFQYPVEGPRQAASGFLGTMIWILEPNQLLQATTSGLPVEYAPIEAGQFRLLATAMPDGSVHFELHGHPTSPRKAVIAAGLINGIPTKIALSGTESEVILCVGDKAVQVDFPTLAPQESHGAAIKN